MFTDKYIGSTAQTVDSFVLDLKTPSQKPGIFFWGGVPFAPSSFRPFFDLLLPFYEPVCAEGQ
jgi:hypothetical protein